VTVDVRALHIPSHVYEARPRVTPKRVLITLALALFTLWVLQPPIITYDGMLQVRPSSIEVGQTPVVSGQRCYRDLGVSNSEYYEVRLTRVARDVDNDQTFSFPDVVVPSPGGCEKFIIPQDYVSLPPGHYYLYGTATPLHSPRIFVTSTSWRTTAFEVTPRRERPQN
jgi:hypothetical protein